MERLSKTAPVEIDLSKTAKNKNVAVDDTYFTLLDLLFKGYTTVVWNVAQSDSCDICKEWAEKFKNGIDLAKFLGLKRKRIYQQDENGNVVPVIDPETGHQKCEFEEAPGVKIYKDALMYNWAHVGCRCSVTVFDDENGLESQTVKVS